MAKQVVKKGDTSRIEYVFIQDSSSTTGAGLTGLAFNAAGLTAYYVRTGGLATAITLATQTANGAYSSGGFVAVDGTNMPGVYRLDIPDAVFATGVDKAVVMLKGATNMAPLVLEYQLVDYDPENATTLGLTNLDATVSSRLASASITLTSGAVTVGTNNDKTGYALTQAFPTNFSSLAITAGGAVTAGTVGDKTGYSLADATSDAVIADAVWNGATASYGAAGSYGALIETNLDAAISTRSTLDAAGVRTAVGLAAANLDTQLSGIQSDTNDLQTQIGVAGAGLTAIVLTATERNAIADALLDRNMATGTDSGSATVRTPRQALRFMRNKWTNSAGTLTVYKEDDTTSSWTATTTTAAGDPVSSVDPA